MALNINPSHPSKHRHWKIFLVETVHTEESNLWMLFVDGYSINEGSGVRVLLISLQGKEIKLVIWLYFRPSNNAAENEALLIGL